MENRNNNYLSADAVMKAFKLSGKKHLFITGSRGVGKSTIVKNIIDSITDETIRHVFSYAVRGRGVYIRDNAELPKIQVGEYSESSEETAGSTNVENKMKPIEDGFYQVIDECFKTINEQWVVIDEIGYLEAGCDEYLFTINQMLRDRRFIAVIRKQELPHLKRFLRNPDAFVIDLDEPTDKLGCIITACDFGKQSDDSFYLRQVKREPMLSMVVNKAAGLYDKCVVVTDNANVAKFCEGQGIEYAFEENINKAGAASLGISMIKETKACVIMSANEPMLSRESVENIVLSLNYNPFQIWRLFYGEKVSETVAIPGRLYDQLGNIPAGKSVNYVIKNNQDMLRFIEASHKMELTKVDSDESYQMVKMIVENNIF